VNSLASELKGRLYAASAGNSNCNVALGRACQVNALDNTKGTFPKLETSFFSDFADLSIASARLLLRLGRRCRLTPVSEKAKELSSLCVQILIDMDG
jgi:hypothetical protein